MAASRGLKKSSKTNGRQEQEDWMVVKKKGLEKCRYETEEQ